MGFLGISDLRNPNQWYCSDGDKNRMIHWITKTSHSKIVLFYNLGNHAVSYALFALLVIVGFVHICVTVISILLSCYTAFCATKSYPGIVCNCNNPSLNDQPNIWRSEATEVTDPIRPPGNFTITYSLITHHFFMLWFQITHLPTVKVSNHEETKPKNTNFTKINKRETLIKHQSFILQKLDCNPVLIGLCRSSLFIVQCWSSYS